MSILAASLNNWLLHKFSNSGLDGNSGIYMFNAGVCCVWITILGGIAVFSSSPFVIEPTAVLWGILYGTLTAAFLHCKMQAMSTGPVSLTTFIGNSSLLISTLFGVLILKEGATGVQLIGVVLLVAALLAVTSFENTAAEKSWLPWCAAFFTCAAASGIVFKLFGYSSASENINAMMLFASVTSTVMFSFLAFVSAKRENRVPTPLPKECVPYLVGCGIVSCIYNRLNIFLAGKITSVIFYPVFNGAVLLISVLVGVAVFKEKLKSLQIWGIALGFIALVLISAGG